MKKIDTIAKTLDDIAAQNKLRYYKNNKFSIIYHKACLCSYYAIPKNAGREPCDLEETIRRRCKRRASSFIKTLITENIIEGKISYHLSYLEKK